jgi:hypothetical protein
MGEFTGSIDIGKQADIAIVSLTGLHQRPVVDPLSTLLMHSRPSDVKTVLVAGDVLKSDGVLTGDRAARAVRLVDAAWDRLSPQIQERGGNLPARPADLLERMTSKPTEFINDAAWPGE